MIGGAESRTALHQQRQKYALPSDLLMCVFVTGTSRPDLIQARDSPRQ